MGSALISATKCIGSLIGLGNRLRICRRKPHVGSSPTRCTNLNVMSYCTSCGLPIPEGQGSSCSMCYGDIGHGKDGYYKRWAEEQVRQEEEDKGECKECGKSWYFCTCGASDDF